jgi:hypothetical protein
VCRSYYVVAQAGSIAFRLALDTGSADTFLLSTACASRACASVPRYPLLYDSPTFGAVNANATAFNVSYADGTRESVCLDAAGAGCADGCAAGADGFVATETVALANVSAPAQAIGLVQAANISFSSEISGVLGLSFPRLSTITQSLASGTVPPPPERTTADAQRPGVPFFATLAQRGLLAYPLFGLSLTRGDDGSLALGAVDGGVLPNASALSWHPVFAFPPFAGERRNASGYLHWALALDALGVNGSALAPEPTYANWTGNRSIALFDVCVGAWSGTRGSGTDVWIGVRRGS